MSANLVQPRLAALPLPSAERELAAVLTDSQAAKRDSTLLERKWAVVTSSQTLQILQ